MAKVKTIEDHKRESAELRAELKKAKLNIEIFKKVKKEDIQKIIGLINENKDLDRRVGSLEHRVSKRDYEIEIMKTARRSIIHGLVDYIKSEEK